MSELWARTKSRLRGRYRVAPFGEAQSGLQRWFESDTGAFVFEQQQQSCTRGLSPCCGYRATQLAVSADFSLLDSVRTAHKFLVARNGVGAACHCNFEELALPSNTVDLVLLHHILDYSANPHDTLIEAARVVSQGGHIAIVGFNPLSLFGFWKWPARVFSSSILWRHNSLRAGRLVDWLRLLGFSVDTGVLVEPSRGAVSKALPWWRRALLHLFVGRRAYYLIVAQKKSVPVNPLRHRRWSPIRVKQFAGLRHRAQLAPRYKSRRKR